VQDSAYQEAYRTCFRIRVYHWVKADLPKGSALATDEIMSEWLGVRAVKTFQNMKARFNGTTTSLDWLRKRSATLSPRDAGRLQTLSHLLDGPLTLLPIHSHSHSHSVDLEFQGDKNMIDAVRMSASGLDRIVSDIKQRARAEETEIE
jgi:hypothetical protein